jgi:hypothetical protein
MRKIILVGVVALACGTAQAQDLTNVQIAQAPQAVPATEAAPAPQAAPAAAPQAAAPEAVTPPAAKPVKKRQAKRRETDEEKARRIAAKYGVSW